MQSPGPIKMGQGISSELQRVQAERVRFSRGQEELNRQVI